MQVGAMFRPFPAVVAAPQCRDGLYIGRTFGGFMASRYANRFSVGEDTWENRIWAVWRFLGGFLEEDARKHMGDVHEAKRLVCWCAPKFCHGHALAWMVAHSEMFGSPCPGCGKTRRSWWNCHSRKADRLVIHEESRCICGGHQMGDCIELQPWTICAWAAMLEDNAPPPAKDPQLPLL